MYRRHFHWWQKLFIKPQWQPLNSYLESKIMQIGEEKNTAVWGSHTSNQSLIQAAGILQVCSPDPMLIGLGRNAAGLCAQPANGLK